MNILASKKFNLIINVLIVSICIAMLIFFKFGIFEKILISMILILKLLSILDYFKKQREELKKEINKNSKKGKKKKGVK
ncbi:hypothetical protein [Parvimonas parva]|uniref:Uncharacterized protein n=1 Tax=Parvimonas parva TaxID=2769485 RepID=A0ABS1C8E8_9FIRM|nr:hypothetical protein [Parvimonas parva]MBK1468367.1 hypothetical protein [Parvimonas parva]